MGELGTIELECGHRFCGECTIEQMKGTIEAAQISKLKCFDYECGQAISAAKIQSILTERSMADLFEKFERFKAQKDIDSDPLVRWCPKAGCGAHIKAQSSTDRKLTCSKCNTSLCFLCRDVWHGELTCEEAM